LELDNPADFQASNQLPWVASTGFPIQPQKALLPSFCSALAARSYSLQVQVKVDGAHHDPIDFEVPLQVIYPKPNVRISLAHDNIGQPTEGRSMTGQLHNLLIGFQASLYSSRRNILLTPSSLSKLNASPPTLP
jgi:hypothetical protein